MKKITSIIILLIAATWTITAQTQFEVNLGIDNRDFLDMGIAVGYNFPEKPYSVGAKFSCSTYNGRRGCDGWSPTNNFGAYFRVHSPGEKIRASLDVVGEICVRNGYCPCGQSIERGLYLQPAVWAIFSPRCALKLNLFKFGVWGVRRWPTAPIQSVFSAQFNTYSLSFVVNL